MRRLVLILTLTALLSGGSMMLAGGCGPGGKVDTGSLIRGGGTLLQSQTLTPRQEKVLGQTVAVQLTNRYPLLYDDPLTDYVSKVGLCVASGVGKTENVRFIFGVLDTPQVGAWAGPTGYILITRGALAMMRDESELAGVLAHEMAHAVKRHGVEQFKQAGLMSGLADVGRGLAGGGENAQFINSMAAGADLIVSKPYSRQNESEADAEAVKFLVRSGYSPKGLLTFLKRLQQTQGREDGGGQMFSTHPGLSDRIAAIGSQISRGGYAPGAVNKGRFISNTARIRA